jgi:hypothetical protein
VTQSRIIWLRIRPYVAILMQLRFLLNKYDATKQHCLNSLKSENQDLNLYVNFASF